MRGSTVTTGMISCNRYNGYNLMGSGDALDQRLQLDDHLQRLGLPRQIVFQVLLLRVRSAEQMAVFAGPFGPELRF